MKLDIDSEYEMAAHNIDSRDHKHRQSLVMKEWILVTGGAGYVGSHCVTQILQSGHHVVILDCLSNSSLGQRLRETFKVEKRKK